MDSPVQPNFLGIFLQAVHSPAFHAVDHVLDTVDVRQIGVKHIFLLRRQFVLDAVKVLTRECPLPHRKELQDFETLTDAVLDAQHAAG